MFSRLLFPENSQMCHLECGYSLYFETVKINCTGIIARPSGMVFKLVLPLNVLMKIWKIPRLVAAYPTSVTQLHHQTLNVYLWNNSRCRHNIFRIDVFHNNSVDQLNYYLIGEPRQAVTFSLEIIISSGSLWNPSPPHGQIHRYKCPNLKFQDEEHFDSYRKLLDRLKRHNLTLTRFQDIYFKSKHIPRFTQGCPKDTFSNEGVKFAARQILKKLVCYVMRGGSAGMKNRKQEEIQSLAERIQLRTLAPPYFVLRKAQYRWYPLARQSGYTVLRYIFITKSW